jgi:hypothetical protein
MVPWNGIGFYSTPPKRRRPIFMSNASDHKRKGKSHVDASVERLCRLCADGPGRGIQCRDDAVMGALEGFPARRAHGIDGMTLYRSCGYVLNFNRQGIKVGVHDRHRWFLGSNTHDMN